jgi:hypothetical protein
MATQKLIETSLASEFALVGAGHLSGVYNLVESVQGALSRLPFGELGSTYYIPYAVTALQKVYGNLYSDTSEFFESPYEATIESLFPTTMDIGLQDLILENKMPILLSSLVTDEFIKAAFDKASPLNRALVLNTTSSFVPKAPTLLCGGSRDPVVDYRNAEDALAAFRAAGAPAVRAFDVEQDASYQPLLRDDLGARRHRHRVPRVARPAAMPAAGKEPVPDVVAEDAGLGHAAPCSSLGAVVDAASLCRGTLGGLFPLRVITGLVGVLLGPGEIVMRAFADIANSIAFRRHRTGVELVLGRKRSGNCFFACRHLDVSLVQ